MKVLGRTQQQQQEIAMRNKLTEGRMQLERWVPRVFVCLSYYADISTHLLQHKKLPMLMPHREMSSAVTNYETEMHITANRASKVFWPCNANRGEHAGKQQ